jgi:hypothetical protein
MASMTTLRRPSTGSFGAPARRPDERSPRLATGARATSEILP